MVLGYLSSFVCSASLLILIVWGKDWRQIIVYDLEVVPNRVRTFEGTPVIAHCGSFSLTNWTYQRFGNTEKIFLTNELFSFRTPFIYHILNRSIILNNLSATDSGLFYCHGTYNTGYYGIVTFSSSIRVSVEQNTEEAPDYVVIPNYIEVSEGDSVTLRCKSDKPVEWFSSRLKYMNTIVQNDSITLKNLRKVDSGLYLCRGIALDFITGVLLFTRKPFHRQARIVVDGYVSRSRGRYVPGERRDFSQNFL